MEEIHVHELQNDELEKRLQIAQAVGDELLRRNIRKFTKPRQQWQPRKRH